MIYNFIAKLTIVLLKILSFLLVCFILLIILSWVSPHISNIHSFPQVERLLNFESNINQTIRHHIPTKIAGYELSRIFTLIVLTILIEQVQSLISKIQFSMQKRQMTEEFTSLQKTYKSPVHKEKMALLESKLTQASTASSKNRQELLKEFVNIKKELEKIGRDLAFLAIDVVDSTGMKEGEDPAIVEHDFNEYHDFVEAKFKEHGFIKAAWTPDGVMACFNTIENAVQAAQSILEGLEYFNKHVKTMKRDFVVRCGVNGGFVYYDDSVPLEQFSDRTIDIAGHMQKHAPPNSILIAKQILEPVTSHQDFAPTKNLVDGLEVCEWNKTEEKK